jgi:hypothetical protein
MKTPFWPNPRDRTVTEDNIATTTVRIDDMIRNVYLTLVAEEEGLVAHPVCLSGRPVVLWSPKSRVDRVLARAQDDEEYQKIVTLYAYVEGFYKSMHVAIEATKADRAKKLALGEKILAIQEKLLKRGC